DEITGELLAAVSGLLPAGIIVRATPSDAVVIIDGAFAGRGDMDMHTNFPKDVEVEVSAPGYAPFVFPLELNPGELAEVFIDLTPLSLSVFNVEVAANPDSLVYQGGLFVGQTPHTFEIPKGQFAYITVETEEGKMGTVVYRNDQIVRGNARLTKIEPVRFLNGKDNGYADGIADDGIDSGAANGQAENVRPVPTNTLFVNTAFPRPPESTPVERARKGFYRAYGALWIILPATLITSGIAMTYIDANTRATISPPEGMTAATRREIYDRALLASDVRDVAFGVMGVTIGITVFQIIRYLYVSSKDATPLIPAVKPPVEEL
ncbi:MAG: PEGA domain-containing protein, partial [Treponema sp.]|nr:PEGA domain-containing protein [Treponema sp.]